MNEHYDEIIRRDGTVLRIKRDEPYEVQDGETLRCRLQMRDNAPGRYRGFGLGGDGDRLMVADTDRSQRPRSLLAVNDDVYKLMVDDGAFEDACAELKQAYADAEQADAVAWQKGKNVPVGDRITRRKETRDRRGRLVETSEEIEENDQFVSASDALLDARELMNDGDKLRLARDAVQRAYEEREAEDANAWRKGKGDGGGNVR